MLKPVEPNSQTIAVWEKDPALSLTHLAELEKTEDGKNKKKKLLRRLFRDPGTWQDVFKTKEGQKPTKFVVGVIPSSDLNRLEDEYGNDNPSRLFWFCFLHGLRDILDSDFREIKKVKRNGVEYVDPAWIEQNFVGYLRQCAIAIGRNIFAWNNVQEEDLKNL